MQNATQKSIHSNASAFAFIHVDVNISPCAVKAKVTITNALSNLCIYFPWFIGHTSRCCKVNLSFFFSSWWMELNASNKDYSTFSTIFFSQFGFFWLLFFPTLLQKLSPEFDAGWFFSPLCGITWGWFKLGRNCLQNQKKHVKSKTLRLWSTCFCCCFSSWDISCYCNNVTLSTVNVFRFRCKVFFVRKPLIFPPSYFSIFNLHRMRTKTDCI